MKKILLITLGLFAMQNSRSQQVILLASNTVATNNEQGQLVKKMDKTVTLMNQDYLNSTTFQTNTAVVRQMEKEAAHYTIHKAAIYDDSEKATYLVTFKNGKHRLTARYDAYGKILSTSEVYKNIAMPTHLKVAISKAHPNWVFGPSRCHINYDRYKGTQIAYKVQLRNGKQKKTIRFKA